MKKNLLVILFLALSFTIFAQDEDSSNGSNDFGMGIGLSNQTIDGLNYQTVALMPELDLGFFGIGLNVDLRFRLAMDGGEPSFVIYKDDWIIEDGTPKEYLSLYLAKFAYIRFGEKNSDFYLKAGQFKGATLGNGTILSNYSNTQFLPEKRLFGLALDIDGQLFNFPYVGFESFVGNIAAFDVIGARLYTRPLTAFEIPVVSNIEIGATGVFDRDPYFYNDTQDSVADDRVAIYSADIKVPVVNSGLFSMNIMGDWVFQNESSARIAGIGGSVISLINYKLQYIDSDENYIYQYFNSSYDLNRTSNNFDIYHGNVATDAVIPAKKDMTATLGFEIPKILYFDAELTNLLSLTDTPALTAEEAPQLYPSLKGNLHLDNEILKIVSADFYYLKNGIDNFSSIFDATNALIGGEVNYYSGNMVVGFLVDVKYNGDADIDAGDEQWITNTQISVNFEL